MNIERQFLAVAAFAFLLGGCAVDPETGNLAMATPQPLGEATRTTMMAQVIDPDPVYDTLVPETSGEHAAQAIDRYRTDSVKQAETIRTTEGTGD